jgi:hypothetical protein
MGQFSRLDRIEAAITRLHPPCPCGVLHVGMERFVTLSSKPFPKGRPGQAGVLLVPTPPASIEEWVHMVSVIRGTEPAAPTATTDRVVDDEERLRRERVSLKSELENMSAQRRDIWLARQSDEMCSIRRLCREHGREWVLELFGVRNGMRNQKIHNML